MRLFEWMFAVSAQVRIDYVGVSLIEIIVPACTPFHSSMNYNTPVGLFI